VKYKMDRCEHNEEKVMIECNHLTKIFKGRGASVYALKDVSLSIKSGQIVGLIGPNGAGKTTLLSLIAGLIFPTQGHITVCGHHARSIKARYSLGYMPEFPVFLGGYSARAVLQYHGALLGLSRRAIHKEVDRLLNQLELEHAADRQCFGFSQGMKQRLALGIALINNPKVLLLDEPSNGLDPIGVIKLRELLKQLCALGKTILVSSHRLGELEKLTSHYTLLNHGQIVSFGDEIASNQGGQLRIGLVSGGNSIAKQILSHHAVLDKSDTEIVVRVNNEENVPDIVCEMVNVGARITNVILHKDSIEDIFIRLCNERI
jgi:ABC-2 type transport system ATP-binding protein